MGNKVNVLTVKAFGDSSVELMKVCTTCLSALNKCDDHSASQTQQTLYQHHELRVVANQCM